MSTNISSDLLKKYSTTRITDISYEACRNVEKMNNSDLDKLYNFHLNLCIPPNAVHPMSNWQAHRLMLMSCIALKQRDMAKARRCDSLLMNWIRISKCHDRCSARSQDFHWRDSVTYLVYGVQAFAQAALYLQTLNPAWIYKRILKPYIDFINLYETGRRTHIEFRNSKIESDKSKDLYLKPYPIGYAKQLMIIYNQLK